MVLASEWQCSKIDPDSHIPTPTSALMISIMAAQHSISASGSAETVYFI